MTKRNKEKTLREKAEQKMRFRPVPVHRMSEADIATVIQELRTHEIELEMQNEALHEAQIELATSRRKYADLFDFAPIGYFVFDERGCIEEVNLTGAAMLGKDRRDVKGKPFNLFVDALDKDRFRQHREGVFQTGRRHQCKLRLLGPDHATLVARVRSQPLVDPDDESKVLRCRTTMTNITDLERAQEDLRQREEQLRLALEGGRLGFWDRDLRTEGITWSPYLYELLGRDPQGPAITGETFFDYVHPEDRPRVRRHFQQSYESGQVDYSDEFRIVRQDGRVRWLVSSGRIYRNDRGRPIRIGGVYYDVTDRREAEEALRASHQDLEVQVQERTKELHSTVLTLEEEVLEHIKAERHIKQQNETLQAIIDNIPVMLCFYDAEGEVALINEALCKTLGYSLEDFQANDVMTLCYPNPAYRKEVWEYMKTAPPNDWRDFLVQTKDRGKIASSWTNVQLSDGSYLGIGIDIRRRKRLENRIRSSEERYRTLVELSPDGIGVERKGIIQFVNSTACRLLRAESPADLIGKPIIDFIHPDYRQRTIRQLQFLRHRRKPLRVVEAQVVALDGSVLDVELSEMPIAFENKPATQIIMRDITQRKEAQARLRENARQLQQQAELLDLAHDTILVQDMEGRITFWNQGAERSYGWTKEQAVGQISHELLNTRFPCDVTDITTAFLKTGRWTGELTHTTRSGKTVIVSSRWALQRNEEGEPTGILEIDRDVTDRRRAERESLEARRFAESILGTIQEALIVLDATLTVISANRTFYDTFAVTPADTEGRPIYEIGDRQWDLPDLRKLMEDILPHNTSFENFEVDHDFKHIGRRTMLLNARRIYRETERTEMILLAIQDVTLRKQQEREILENQRQLAELTEELLLTEERERRQIATALHDSVGQSLAFSKRELATLRKDLPAALMAKFDRAKSQIDEAIAETRSLTFDLSPTTLYMFGLEAALEELAEQFSKRHGFACHFEAQEGNEPLPEQTKVLLYRATRELLINAAKHAEARNVYIQVTRTERSVRIEVEDDGKGFDLAELEPVQGKPRGFGLFSIRERLGHTNGTFDVRSIPGDGTCVIMQAALEPTEETDFGSSSS